MNFDLSDEQYLLQDQVRKFLDTAMPPQRVIGVFNDDRDLDRGLWQGLADLGVTGIGIPEERGGVGLGLLDLAVVAEILGYCGTPGPFLVHAMAASALVAGGDVAQKQAWLPKLASGAVVASVALNEEGDLWQPEDWRLAPDGGRLTGAKRNVLFAKDADLFIVGLAGGALALVEKGANGLSVEPVDGVDRTRKLGWLHFKNTPCALLPGGPDAARLMCDRGLVLLAADAFGGATRAVDLAVDYVKTREQFGRPVGAFQGIKHQVATIGTAVEVGRGLYWYAAFCGDCHAPAAARVAALAKALLTDRFVEAARACVELHGGIGYTWDYYAQIWVKRAFFDRQYLGPPSLHRERAAALAGW